ncbi:MAG: hypothetical protein VX899_15725 [Myxococcota bacterium]|nr:hypothetical protein [Myxococcota bacterium]
MHIDAATSDLLFTILASGALLGLWAASALVLPWRARDLDRVEQELEALAGERPVMRPRPLGATARHAA